MQSRALLPLSPLLFAFGVAFGAERSAAAQAAEDVARLPTVTRSSFIRLRVVSGLETARAIAGMLPPLGGRVLRSSEAETAAEVPTARYRDFVAELRRLGELRKEQVSSKDVSAALADAESEARAARAAFERRRQMARVATGVNDKLALERELSSASSRALLAEGRVRELQSSGEAVNVTVSFEAEAKEPIEASQLPFPWLDDLGLERLADPPSQRSDQSRALRSLTDFGLTLNTAYVPRAEALDGTKLAVALGFDLRSLGEANPIGLFGGFDLAAGASAGFVYGSHFVLGAGMPLGKRFAFGVGAGGGIDGITSVVPIGLVVPVEVWVGWDLADFMHLSLRAQNAWVPASDERRHGSERALFGDELSAGLHVVIDERSDWGSSQRRGGLLVGAGYRELMGTSVVELRLGIGGVNSEFSGDY